MGLIRKTLAVSTLGAVKGSSKKQRVAKKTLAAVEQQTQNDQRLAVANATLQANLVGTPEARRAALEYELSLLPRAMHRNFHQRKRAKQIEAELRELA